MEVDADSELSAASKASFLDKVRQSNQACQSGDFEKAVGLYGEAIALDPCNHILFSNRSAALVKLGHFARALQDASRAVELNAKWPKVSPSSSYPHQVPVVPSLFLSRSRNTLTIKLLPTYLPTYLPTFFRSIIKLIASQAYLIA